MKLSKPVINKRREGGGTSVKKKGRYRKKMEGEGKSVLASGYSPGPF